ncbi:hypothetical protein U5A82_00460 [Sphingobium sp. CR2-8]|uniref:hypothetical protein n=1 Tax=Sphingobium sp. CR2-8 TaxID=1306534 RepID=UPI002DB6F460|nr:hypothetical protein [Sphingobium sp. CR2-8]MEC3908999.1 hypothetical protein [Sphingobium sp. CR2-8]
MLNIAAPHLSPAEWRDVKATLNAVAGCGCGKASVARTFKMRFGHLLRPSMGPPKAAATSLSAPLRPVRDFLCETGRTRRLAERHIPTLTAQGFSRAQIEALALLGA